MSPDGKLVLVEADDTSFFDAKEVKGTHGYNDLLFIPVTNGIDVWSTNGATGYVNSSLTMPTCVGVYGEDAYAYMAGSGFAKSDFYSFVRGTCNQKGYLEIIREDFPAICFQEPIYIINAQIGSKGYCKHGEDIVAEWDYPTPYQYPN